MLKLRNPHSILAAFRERPDSIIDVRLPIGRLSGAWSDVDQLARSHRVPTMTVSVEDRPPRRGDKGGRGGAAEATVKGRPDVPLETLFAGTKPAAETPADETSAAEQGGRPHRLWLALDQVQDPHNVGAIFRTAAFFGVAGIVVTRDRSAPLNSTVYDVASGGLEVVPFANPSNLSRALDVAKECGLWVLGASEHAETDVREIDRERSWILVLGNEEKGLRRLTSHHCDEVCRIPSLGGLDSLNVSVAAGVLIAGLTLFGSNENNR